MTMTPTNFDSWIKALRSGDYLQASEHLSAGVTVDDEGNEETGYCCLGVLCLTRDINLHEGVYNPNMDYPMPLAEFGGAEDSEILGTPLEPVLGDLTEGQRRTLAGFNDRGWSFSDIADYLVEHRAEFVDGE